MKWARKAAEQGNYLGQDLLGYLYANGQGVSQDYVQAHLWFNLSATQGYATGKKNRDRAVELMTPAQIAEAQKLAREWMVRFEARQKK